MRERNADGAVFEHTFLLLRKKEITQHLKNAQNYLV